MSKWTCYSSNPRRSRVHCLDKWVKDHKLIVFFALSFKLYLFIFGFCLLVLDALHWVENPLPRSYFLRFSMSWSQPGPSGHLNFPPLTPPFITEPAPVWGPANSRASKHKGLPWWRKGNIQRTKYNRSSFLVWILLHSCRSQTQITIAIQAGDCHFICSLRLSARPQNWALRSHCSRPHFRNWAQVQCNCSSDQSISECN